MNDAQITEVINLFEKNIDRFERKQDDTTHKFYYEFTLNGVVFQLRHQDVEHYRVVAYYKNGLLVDSILPRELNDRMSEICRSISQSIEERRRIKEEETWDNLLRVAKSGEGYVLD